MPSKKEKSESESEAEPPIDAALPKDKVTGQMMTGDYQIHVFIQMSKCFTLESDSTVDPLIEVACFSELKYSSSKEKIPTGGVQATLWNEHIFFDFRNKHSSEMENGIISIRVKNKGLLRDEIIGVYDIDITKIYFLDNHTVEHQWLGLINPEGECMSSVTGNLKVSLSITGEHDRQKLLQLQSTPEDPNQQLLMPAQVTRTFKQLKLRFIIADHMPKLDTALIGSGSMDVYIEVIYLGKKIRTEVKKASSAQMIADIEQEVWIPIQMPLSSDRIIFRVMDQDAIQDEIAGSMYFKLSQLIELGEAKDRQGQQGSTFWHNLYGAPLNRSGKYSTLMNENPEFASTWKGRILMQVECSDAEQPEMSVQPLSPEIHKHAEALGYFSQSFYDVAAEVGQGIALPTYKHKFRILVRIGDFTMLSDSPVESAKGYNRWSQRIEPKDGSFKSTYPALKQFDQVFVYLCTDDETPVCFWHGSIDQFTDPNPQYQWLVLTNDLSIGKVKKPFEAGIIQLKLSIRQRLPGETAAYNFRQHQSWSKKPLKRFNNFKMRLFIYQCRGIPSADENGLSDCYLSVWNQAGEQKKTLVAEDSLNPIYYQVIDYYADIGDSEAVAPPVLINLWDRDSVLESDDYLGSCLVRLDDASTNEFKSHGHTPEDLQECNRIPKPQWHPIHFGFDQDTPQCGEILMSIVVAPSDYLFQPVNLRSTVPSSEYKISLNILGLRELQSPGILPVRKPFIKFRVKSLLPHEQAQGVANIETDPNYPGANPNINTLLQFSCALPDEELFCPALTCEVYDHIFLGLSQPLIGSFTIPIGELRTENRKKRNQELQLAEKILEMLVKSNEITSARLIEMCSKTTELSPAAQVLMKSMKQNKKRIRDAMKANQSKSTPSKVLVAKSIIGQSLMGGYTEQVDENDDQPSEASVDLDEVEDSRRATVQDLESQIEILTHGCTESKGVSKVTRRLDTAQNALRLQLKEISKKKSLLKNEQAQQQSTQRELDEFTIRNHNTKKGHAFVIPMVVMPQYAKDEQLQFYSEIGKPACSLYKGVGYNSVDVINKYAKLQLSITDQKALLSEEDSQDNEQKHIILTSESLDQFDTSRRNMAQSALFRQQELDKQRKNQTELHYRLYYQQELELNRDIFPNPIFTSIPLRRGQSRGINKSVFSLLNPKLMDESGQLSSENTVGRFKGLIDVKNEKEMSIFYAKKQDVIKQIWENFLQLYKTAFKKNLPFGSFMEIHGDKDKTEKFIGIVKSMGLPTQNITQFVKMQSFELEIMKEMQRRTKCTVELYILEGADLASRDIGSNSDPYLKVALDTQRYNERKNYQLDQPNPKFNRHFSFTSEFPGSASITIEVMDYDDLFGDDLIGRTMIDLDDRFFSPEWQSLKEKPIEQRQLYHNTSRLSQGLVLCWLEIHTQSKKHEIYKSWNLSQEPVTRYEVRLSVSGCTDLPNMDIEGTSDVFVRAFIDDKSAKTTDTHYRCKTGKPSFNYRLLFDVELPREETILRMQAYDRDLFQASEFICEWQFDLKEILDVVRMTNQQAQFSQKYLESRKKVTGGFYDSFRIKWKDDSTFWLTAEGFDGKDMRILIDLRVLSYQNAQEEPVGSARQEPNIDPYLPAPSGRLHFSWNPFEMISQLIGASFGMEIAAALCLVLGCICIIMMIPTFFSDLLANAVASAI